jgi:hypothetical protein
MRLNHRDGAGNSSASVVVHSDFVIAVNSIYGRESSNLLGEFNRKPNKNACLLACRNGCTTTTDKKFSSRYSKGRKPSMFKTAQYNAMLKLEQ